MNGGVLSALNFLTAGVAATVTFVAFPHVYYWSWSWVSALSIGRYSLGMQDWAPWVWSGLIIWLLYSGTRTALLLLMSLSGIAAVIAVLFRRGGRD